VIGSWVVIEFVTGVRPDSTIRKYVCFGSISIDEAVEQRETDFKTHHCRQSISRLWSEDAPVSICGE
jgi:hypothetical protein